MKGIAVDDLRVTRMKEPLNTKTLVDILRTESLSVEEIAVRFNVPIRKVTDTIEELSHKKTMLSIVDGKYSVKEAPVEGGRKVLDPDLWRGDTIRFGFTSDNHLCSHFERLDVLNLIYDICEGEGVKTVLNGGNWIDGEARFNKNEIHKVGLDRQISYAVKVYPYRKGIETWFVSGDDHEGWYCFSPDTEILTKEKGWVLFSELDGSEHVATKSEAGCFEWQIPTKIVVNEHSGDMINISHRSVDLSVTPYHRFECFVKSSMHGEPKKMALTAQEIVDNFKPRCIGIPRTTDAWVGNTPESIDIQIQPCRYQNHKKIFHPLRISGEKLAHLCAWYATEGCVSGNVISIAQSAIKNKENYNEIISLICDIAPCCYERPECVSFSSKDVAQYLIENCGGGSENKRLPDWVLNSDRQTLNAVFDILIKGDGHLRENGGCKFYTISKTLEAQISEIAQKIGKTISFAEGNGCRNISVGDKFPVAWLFDKPKIGKYTGKTYCVSVPNQRIFVRRNGKTAWSMNCQREGIAIGDYFQSKREQAGMFDLKHLGYVEADIDLNEGKFENGSWLRVMHAGGGSAYATSYAAQKIVESLQGGEKPSVLFIGHYHKLLYAYIRNVHTIQMGATQDQSIFMRKKKIEAHVGGGIVELRRDKFGSIVRCKVDFITAFDKKFYVGKDKYWKSK